MKMDYEKQDELLFQAVDKLKAGNKESFNDVYEYSKKYIYKIIYDVVKDNTIVEDMMQETYLQIYNKIGTLENSRVFLIWAGRIATNYSLRYIQKQRDIVAADLTGEDGEEFVFDTVADDNEEFIPEAAVMDQEKVRLIGEILDGLSPEQKIAVQFFYYEEMSVRDIAKACNCSEGTIKSRLNYARKSIKTAVQDLEVNKNTKLYSLASLPVFYVVFRKEALLLAASIFEKLQIAESILKGLFTGAGNTAGQTVEFATKQAQARVEEVASSSVAQEAGNGAGASSQTTVRPSGVNAVREIATSNAQPESAVGVTTGQNSAVTATQTATATAGKAVGTKIAIGLAAAVVVAGGATGGLIAAGVIDPFGSDTKKEAEKEPGKTPDKSPDKKDPSSGKIDLESDDFEYLGEFLTSYVYTYGDGIVLQIMGGDNFYKSYIDTIGTRDEAKLAEAVEYLWMYATMDEDYIKDKGNSAQEEMEEYISESKEEAKQIYPKAQSYLTGKLSKRMKGTLKTIKEVMASHDHIEYGEETDEDWEWLLGELPYFIIEDEDDAYIVVLEKLEGKMAKDEFLSIDKVYDDPEYAFMCGAQIYKINGDSTTEATTTETPSIDVPATDVPANSVAFNGHHYMIYDQNGTWQEAVEFCESLGGHLATITSKEEDDYVYEYMKSFDYNSAYFGYTDEASEGTWVWVTGEESDYDNWNPGEPNNERGKENYAMYYYKNSGNTWNDGDFGNGTVGNNTAFICEWDY